MDGDHRCTSLPRPLEAVRLASANGRARRTKDNAETVDTIVIRSISLRRHPPNVAGTHHS
jgi:hypothetical protein